MEWNRKKRANQPVREYVPVDPEYTLDAKFLCKIFGWSIGTLHKRMKFDGFPRSKSYRQNVTRWHPQQVNDWIKDRQARGLRL